MVLKIILGVAAALVTVVFGNLFWSPRRRRRAIRMILENPAMLTRFVTPDLLREPPPEIAQFARPLDGGYGASMVAFVTADRAAERLGQLAVGSK